MARFLAKPVVSKNGGDEGGEILLEKADTNTTLSGTGVTIDVYQNKIRFFEQGGTARGAYIDLTAAGAGVSSNLLSGSGVTTLDGLTDVVVPTPSGGQILSYDGTNWVNINNYATATKNTVKNDSGASLGVGSVVYTSGANGTNILVKGARADAESTSATVLGFLESALAINGIGFVVTHGLVAGLNTGSASAGDPVWLSTSTAGGFVTGLLNKPSSPNHLVYLGTVTRAHATNGEIFVHILNGWELEELHNVTLTSPQSGDFLKYNGSVWVNDPIDLGTDTVGSYVGTITAGTGVSTTGASTGEGIAHTISIGQSVATNANPTFAGATLDAVQVGITAAGEIDTTTGNLTLDSAGGTTTVDDNLIVTGNLTVSGTTTTLNTETLTVDDNIIVLNNNVTAAPTENAGIEIERGTSTNVLVRWNEANDKWELTNDGTTYGNIVTTADSGTVTSAMIADGAIVNADVNASAAIALSKLASGTSGQVVVANASGVPTYTTISGDITISNTGVATIAADSVALGTDTTGNYMSGASAGTGISVSHTPGEGSTATISLANTSISLNGTSVSLTSAGAQTVTAAAGTLTGTTLNSTVVSSSLTSVGTITSGTWNGTAVAIAYGGTGASTAALARTNLGLVIGTDVQAYNSTLATVASGTYTGATSITTVGTITAGTWSGSFGSASAGNLFLASPNGASGAPVFRAIVPADIPTLNQNTTGSAATLTTSRTIQTSLSSTSSASFNGSANITPGVTGILGVGNGGTGVTTSTGTGNTVLSASPTLTGTSTYSLGSLSSTAGTALTAWSTAATTTNFDFVDLRLIRRNYVSPETGSDWASAYYRVQRLVDSTRQGYIQFGSHTASSEQSVCLGVNNTTYLTITSSGISGGSPSSETVFATDTRAPNSYITNYLVSTGSPTGSGNAAQWLSAFGQYYLVRNTSTLKDKENIQSVNTLLTADMLDDVEIKLWNRKIAPGIPEIGPIAEEMDEISPFLSTRGMTLNDDGEIVPTPVNGINQNSWISLITIALQDARAEIKKLNARIDVLESQ